MNARQVWHLMITLHKDRIPEDARREWFFNYVSTDILEGTLSLSATELVVFQTVQADGTYVFRLTWDAASGRWTHGEEG